jgi:hypothetical protein
MSNAELFQAMQNGTPITIRNISKSPDVSNLPSRIIRMEVESGIENVNCWNLLCREVKSGRQFNAFVRIT